ncbi:MAG TPA: MFS transporter [Nitrospira sp.]|nr:MFS transporter [Nitrospira sp.]HNG01113.1 MFS transporter [Nitrospira sp.]
MGHLSPFSLADSPPAANVYTANMSDTHRWLLTRDFGFMWWSQVLSQVAEGVSKLALLWFVYAVTGSPLKTTVIGLLQTLPPILFGPFIGVLVDRFPKKAILITSDVARGLLIGLIPCLVPIEHFTVESLYVLTFLFGMATAVFVPTLSSAVPFMVARPQFTAANALLQSTTSLGIIIGPAVSGLGIAFSGSQDVLCVNALTYFASAACLLPIRLRATEQAPDSSAGWRPFIRHLLEGLRYAFLTHRTLLILIVLASIYTFGSGAFTTLFPVFGRQLLGLGPVEVGYLWSWLGVGLLLSSIGLIWLSAWDLHKRLLAIAVSCALAGLAVVGLTWTDSVGVASAYVVCIGIGLGTWTPIAWGIIQEVAPPGMVGRVMAVYTAMATATSMLGMSAFGWVAESFGSITSVLGIGGVMGVLAWGSAWFGGRIRTVGVTEGGNRS